MSSKKTHASVAKLVDATDSKSVDSNIMLVQVRPEVPKSNHPVRDGFFFIYHSRWFILPDRPVSTAGQLARIVLNQRLYNRDNPIHRKQF